jgi:hypothetical protein
MEGESHPNLKCPIFSLECGSSLHGLSSRVLLSVIVTITNSNTFVKV